MISSDTDFILSADKLIMPGVGHFGEAMSNMEEGYSHRNPPKNQVKQCNKFCNECRVSFYEIELELKNPEIRAQTLELMCDELGHTGDLNG